MLTIEERQIDLEGPQSEAGTIIDHTPFILSHCSADLRYVYVSKACARLFGLSPAEIAGKKIKDILGDAAFDAIQPFMKRVLSGETVQYEGDIPYKTAGIRSVRVTYIPEKSASGNVIGWIASIIDLTDQKRAERRIAADLKAMTLLHDLAGYCVRQGAQFDHCLHKILNVGIELVGAAKGTLQLIEPADGSLVIAAQHGFQKAFLDFFSHVRENTGSCAAAMQAMQQVVVTDILTSEVFVGQASQQVLLDENVRAVISTPLISSSGALLGMLSAHFFDPRQPDERELRITNLLVRQAADFLERKQAEQRLRERTEELNVLFSLTPVPIWIASDPECLHIRGNRAAAELYGGSESSNLSQSAAERGLSALRVSHFRGGRELAANELPMQQAARTGESFHEQEMEIVQGANRTAVTGNAVPLFDSHGKVRGVIAALMDVTELKRERENLRRLAEERLVLVQELNHRVKNSLAIVQAMAARTLRDSQDMRTARDLLEGRLVAFAKAHGVLLKSNWQGGSIQDVLSETIPPFWIGRIGMEGPEVFLTANEALKLSMAIFELTTNAIKHGALSNERGRVAISWSTTQANGRRTLELTWTEQEGPAVERPLRKGFGSQILERVLTQDLNAEVLLDFRPSGLYAKIKVLAAFPVQPLPA